MKYVSDAIIRIKNAARARRRVTTISYSKMNKALLLILKNEGFLTDVKEELVDGKKQLIVQIRYEDRVPLMTDCEIISRPSLRKYTGAKNISQKKLGVTILTTNQGIMTLREAQKKGVGGEVLLRVW